jgi:hypothetical protein
LSVSIGRTGKAHKFPQEEAATTAEMNLGKKFIEEMHETTAWVGFQTASQGPRPPIHNGDKEAREGLF